MFFDWNAEHARCGFAVEVFARAEGLEGGCFSGEPGDDPRFDCREVGDNESTSLAGDKRGANELAERVGHGLVQKLKCLEVACSDEASGLVEIRQIVPGEVLDLDEASGVASGTSCSVELDESACSAVAACNKLHGLVFLHR